jgi:ABC-type uncharacterized transport system permease subunit
VVDGRVSDEGGSVVVVVVVVVVVLVMLVLAESKVGARMEKKTDKQEADQGVFWQ